MKFGFYCYELPRLDIILEQIGVNNNYSETERSFFLFRATFWPWVSLDTEPTMPVARRIMETGNSKKAETAE